MPDNSSGSPNGRLATIIADKLSAERLVSPDRKDEVLEGLKTGTLKDRDWRLLLEIAADEREDQDGPAD